VPSLEKMLVNELVRVCWGADSNLQELVPWLRLD